jgi:hypothetical protein
VIKDDGGFDTLEDTPDHPLQTLPSPSFNDMQELL